MPTELFFTRTWLTEPLLEMKPHLRTLRMCWSVRQWETMSIIPRNIPALAGTLRLSFIAACSDPGLLCFLLSGQKIQDFKYFRPNFENIWEFLSALRELLITSFLHIIQQNIHSIIQVYYVSSLELLILGFAIWIYIYTYISFICNKR